MKKSMKSFAALVLFAAALTGCAQDKHQAIDPETTPDAPLAANTRFAAGQVAETQGDPNRAIAQYQAALKTDPNFSPAYYRLGVIYTEHRQFSQAIDFWQKFIKATENSAAGYSNLGYCFEQANQPGEAARAYAQGIKIEPNNQACQVNYGLMLARQGQIAEATAHLSTVLTPGEVHYDLGSVLESQGKKTAAAEQFRLALIADPLMQDAKQRLASLDMN